jgi:ADP-heptose:LPS heptosyltransferase
MRVDALRLLDRYAGVPLCWVLTLLRNLGRAPGGARPLPKPRRILIIKISEMGSTVLACPALAELKQRCPDAALFFLVFKNNAAIIELLDLVPATNIVAVDYRSIGSLFVTGVLAIRRLLREQIDTAIDMDFFSRLTALTSFLVCRGNRVGYHRYNDEGLYRGNLLTHRVLYSPHIHTSAAFMALVRTLFQDPKDEPHYRGRIDPKELTLPKFSPRPNDVHSVGQKLAAAGIGHGQNGMLLLINPNSSDIFPLRKWPLDYFAQLCQRVLSEIPQCQLVITGVAAEQKDARHIMERVRSPRCADFTGKTSFGELMALYSMASLMVTNDSGPAHFASLLQLPTVVLFGPETPRLYGPMGRTHKDLYAEFACSPCVSVYNGKKSPCQENRCLKSISVDEVFETVLGLLPASDVPWSHPGNSPLS